MGSKNKVAMFFEYKSTVEESTAKLNKLLTKAKIIDHSRTMVAEVERFNTMMNPKKAKESKEANIVNIELSDIITEENGLSFEVLSEEETDDDNKE